MSIYPAEYRKDASAAGKILGSVTINILEGNALSIVSTVTDQNTVRDILKTAEEIIIRQSLDQVSKPQSNIIPISHAN